MFNNDAPLRFEISRWQYCRTSGSFDSRRKVLILIFFFHVSRRDLFSFRDLILFLFFLFLSVFIYIILYYVDNIFFFQVLFALTLSEYPMHASLKIYFIHLSLYFFLHILDILYILLSVSILLKFRSNSFKIFS